MKKRAPSADLTIRLISADRKAIDEAAAADHLPASTWLRQAGLRRATELKEQAARRRKLTSLVSRLRKLPRFDRDDA